MTTLDGTSRVVLWAAEECRRQRSGEMSVAWLFRAWRYALRHRSRRPTYGDVLALGRFVEPRKNAAGLRDCGVRVGTDVKMGSAYVLDALTRLVSAQPVPDPAVAFPVDPRQGDRAARYAAGCDAWYRAFEDVHPFVDGNGRVGAVLYNWQMRSLRDPVHPPDFADPAAYWARRPDGPRLWE